MIIIGDKVGILPALWEHSTFREINDMPKSHMLNKWVWDNERLGFPRSLGVLCHLLIQNVGVFEFYKKHGKTKLKISTIENRTKLDLPRLIYPFCPSLLLK